MSEKSEKYLINGEKGKRRLNLTTKFFQAITRVEYKYQGNPHNQGVGVEYNPRTNPMGKKEFIPTPMNNNGLICPLCVRMIPKGTNPDWRKIFGED